MTTPGGWKERRRATARRPITPEEVPYLEAWGAEFRRVRRASPWTRADVAEMASLRVGYIHELEVGTRRPRVETLEALACAVLDGDDLDELRFSEVVQSWVDMLGPTLAPPSLYPEAMARTRARRAKKKAKFADAVEVRARELAMRWTLENAQRRRERGYE